MVQDGKCFGHSLCAYFGPLSYRTGNVGESSGRVFRRSYRRAVETLAGPSHSCTLAIGFMGKGIGGGRRPHRIHTQSVDLDVQAGCLPYISMVLIYV